VLVPSPYVAHAQTYLTEEQAVAAIFPGQKMTAGWFELPLTWTLAIEKKSGEKVKNRRFKIWWGPNRQAVIIDQVLGKHEFITYAAGFNRDGSVKGIEILDYRETYGYEVQQKGWRKQFVGKTKADPLKLDEDIANISGATLSSSHITAGVRRLLYTYDMLPKTR
jgi:Na+-translocating ferredoxin:NAD+ oxidoreductase RnfG subunit